MAGSVLVLGATGHVGTPLVAELVARGERVKAASRGAIVPDGAEAVRIDLADPASLRNALAGVDRAFVLAPGGTVDARPLLLPVVEALAERRVKVVLQTAFGVDADDTIPYRQVELALERSGTPFVILRPNWFADNFHTFWREGVLAGAIALPAGEGRSSFIDVRDVAASAAGALSTSRFDGRAFALTGPEALSYHEAAAVLSRLIGRPVAYTPVDDQSFIDGAVAAGVPADYARFLATIFHPVREGWAAAVTGDVEILAGQPPRTFARYAADHLEAWRG